MALYAFAGTRLLPAMQHVYNSLTKLRFGKAALDTLHKDIEEVKANRPRLVRNDLVQFPDPIKLRKRLELRNVYYTYPKAQTPDLGGSLVNHQSRNYSSTGGQHRCWENHDGRYLVGPA